MVPSEVLELKIFRFAESAGKARWRATDFASLSQAVQFQEDAVLVDALIDLHARAFMEFRQWNYGLNYWVLYAGAHREYFYGSFEMRVTFLGRKYFERLEAQPSDPNQSAMTPELRRDEAAKETATSQAMKDSSRQPVLFPESTNPKAFVSHSTQDRSFADRFAGDLRRYGVDAWYSRWEIKPGDSIRAKIDEGLEGCEFFIIVLSKTSVNRQSCLTQDEPEAEACF